MRQLPYALLAFLCFAVTPFVHAQTQCDAQAFRGILAQVGDTCGGLGRNSLCYGNDAVSVAFWDADAETQFAAPGDLVPTDVVQRIETSRYIPDADLWGVALMRVQANIPNTLPGQAVTFLLMGDTEFTNQTPPDDALTSPDPVAARTLEPTNLRSAPSTQAFVRGSVPAGSELALVGRTDDGAWFELVTDNGLPTWVFAALVALDGDADALPVTGGAGVPPRYGPMQAFYFTTGIGNPQCREAPEAMVVQSPDDYTVRLTVNDLDITLGSTVVAFQTTTTAGQPALALLLTEGDLTAQVGGQAVAVTAAVGELGLLAVETDANGNVPPGAALVPADALDMDALMARLGGVGDVLAGVDGLNIVLGEGITSETVASLDLDVAAFPVIPVVPPSTENPDISPAPSFSNGGGGGNDGGGGDGGTNPAPSGGDDDDDDDDGGGGDGDDDDDDDDGEGVALPTGTITVRHVDAAASRQGGNRMGTAGILMVGAVGLFGVLERRRPQPDA